MPPSPSSNCRIWWDPTVSAYRLTVPYRPDFPPLFKALIPFGDYSWDSSAKVWTFLEKYYEPTKGVVNKMFGSVTAISRTDWETANSASQTSSSGANGSAGAKAPNAGYIPPLNVATLGADSVLVQFVRMLPYEALKKAYLHGAMMYHPDRPDGDAAKQMQLNLLWQRIEKEVYKK
jgi:hypothetical protein